MSETPTPDTLVELQRLLKKYGQVEIQELMARLEAAEAALTEAQANVTFWRDKDARSIALAQEKHDQLTEARQQLGELNAIRELCARRPALDEPTLYGNVAKAIATAKRADEAESRLAALTAERDTMKQALSWLAGHCCCHEPEYDMDHNCQRVQCVSVIASTALAPLAARAVLPSQEPG